MQPLTVSLIQSATHWHHPDKNRQMFEAWLAQVPPQADVVLLPEMFTTGFTMESAVVAESMNDATVMWMQQQAKILDVVLCGSVVIHEAGEFYNRLLWVGADGATQTYDKRHRFRMAGEHEHYQAGENRVIVEHKGWRLLLAVCYDLRFPVWLRNRQDYDAMLLVANWPAARRHAWQSLLVARAIENQCYVAAVNICGVDGNQVEYAGDSVVLRPDGAAQITANAIEGVYTHQLVPNILQSARNSFPVWQDADPFELSDD